MIKTFMAFSCTHFPEQDPAAIAWALKLAEEYQPDVVVHLGDGIEADAASRWDSESDYALEDEFNGLNAFLHEMRMVSGAETCVFLEGNHDANLLEMGRIKKGIRSLCDWRRISNIPEMEHWLHPAEYNYCAKRGAWRLGQVTFSHGYTCGASAGKFEAMDFCREFGLYIHGHTHRPHDVQQVMMTQTRPLNWWYANAGTLGRMDRDYMTRKNKIRWGQAMIVGEAADLRSPRTTRHWDAHMELFRMYTDL
jgi:predicted phosphodiesterase